jgi:hypothetical protein
MHAACRAARTRRVLPRRRFVCAGAAYAFGDYSSNACPTGYTKITDAATCGTALTSMDSSVSYAGTPNSHPAIPTGCLWLSWPNGDCSTCATPLGRFNADPTNGATECWRPLCIRAHPFKPLRHGPCKHGYPFEARTWACGDPMTVPVTLRVL